MKFKNPRIPTLFVGFETDDDLELTQNKESGSFKDAIKFRLLSKNEIHYLIALSLLKTGDSSFWSSTSLNKDYAVSFQASGNVTNSGVNAMFMIRELVTVGVVVLSKKYKTRDDRQVKVFMIDGGGDKPVLGAIKDGESWISAQWTRKGRSTEDIESPNDLIESA
jgi:hypothetical protein